MNPIRIGNFTSSEIFKLMKNGKEKGSLGAPALTYIDEKNMERRLGRALADDIDARELSWGKLVERHVFNILGTDYRMCSSETLSHPTVPYWKGSPDADHYYEESHLDAVCDFKCPKTLKSFCQLVDAWNSGGIAAVRADHKDGEKFYWQLVSNACITDKKYAELIVFAPYESELVAIKEMAANYDGPKQHRYKWIFDAAEDELPFLPDGGHYKNVNVMRFIVPPSDKIALHDRVELCGSHLIKTNNLELVCQK